MTKLEAIRRRDKDAGLLKSDMLGSSDRAYLLSLVDELAAAARTFHVHIGDRCQFIDCAGDKACRGAKALARLDEEEA